MTKRIKVSELPEFDAAEYLSSEEDVAAYLTTVLEENDAALLAAALGDIARSRGMTQLFSIADRRHFHDSREITGPDSWLVVASMWR